MLFYLAPAARGALQKRVSDCRHKCFVATAPLIHRPSRTVQRGAGQRTARGFTPECFKPLDHRLAEEVALVIIKDVAEVPDKAFGNFDNQVALKRTGQCLASLLVVERGVGCAFRESLPAAPHVQASVWSVAQAGTPLLSGILTQIANNVNMLACRFTTANRP